MFLWCLLKWCQNQIEHAYKRTLVKKLVDISNDIFFKYSIILEKHIKLTFKGHFSEICIIYKYEILVTEQDRYISSTY